jgi:hypothetical protein
LLALILTGFTAGAIALWQAAESARDQLAIEKAQTERARQVADQLKREAEETRDRAIKAEEGERAAKLALARASSVRSVALAFQHWRENDVGLARQALDSCPEDLRNWEWRFVNRLCHPELLSIKAHDGEVLAVAMSRDRKRIVSCGRDGTIKGWDTKTGRELYSLRYEPFDKGKLTTVSMNNFMEAAVSPNAELVAAHIGKGTVQVWDGTSGQERLTLKGQHKDGVPSPAGDLGLQRRHLRLGPENRRAPGHTIMEQPYFPGAARASCSFLRILLRLVRLGLEDR